jgi:deoxycytidylate deaminase
MPCTDCANDIVQAKVSEVVIHKQWQDFLYKFAYDKWKESAKRSIQKFNEAGINVRLFDKVLGVQGVLDGKIIDV